MIQWLINSTTRINSVLCTHNWKAAFASPWRCVPDCMFLWGRVTVTGSLEGGPTFMFNDQFTISWDASGISDENWFTSQILWLTANPHSAWSLPTDQGASRLCAVIVRTPHHGHCLPDRPSLSSEQKQRAGFASFYLKSKVAPFLSRVSQRITLNILSASSSISLHRSHLYF